MDAPIFPITFRWAKTGEVETFESLKDIECNVEHFDSDAGDADVTDARGRSVRIRISLLNAETFELLQLLRSDVAIYGGRGLITMIANMKPASLAKLAERYGWK